MKYFENDEFCDQLCATDDLEKSRIFKAVFILEQAK